MKAFCISLIALIVCNVALSARISSSTRTSQLSIIEPDTSCKIEMPIQPIENAIGIDYPPDEAPVEFYDVPLNIEIQLLIRNACNFYNFDERLIYQICYCESKFESENSLPKNPCKGLMAVNVGYASAYLKLGDRFDSLFEEPFDPYDPKQNVVVGIRMLDYWRKVCSWRGYFDIKSILQCYNSGFKYFKKPKNFKYANWVLSTEISYIQ